MSRASWTTSADPCWMVTRRGTEISKPSYVPSRGRKPEAHSYASCSPNRRSGTPIPTIQQLAGHASAATTMRYASHLPGGATQEAIRRRDEIRRAAAQKGHPEGHPEARALPEARPPAA